MENWRLQHPRRMRFLHFWLLLLCVGITMTRNLLIFEVCEISFLCPYKVETSITKAGQDLVCSCSLGKIPECQRHCSSFVFTYRLKMHLLLYLQLQKQLNSTWVHQSSKTNAGGVERDAWRVKHAATSGTPSWRMGLTQLSS